MGSEGQEQSAELQKLQAQHQKDLFAIGYPGLKLSLSDFIKDLGKPGEEPASVKKAFTEANALQQQQFTSQAESTPLTAQQQAKQSGFRGGAGSVDRASSEALFQLESQRRKSQNLMAAQETDAAVSQRDFDLSQILGISEGGIQSSFGYNRNALSAAGMNTKNPWGSALSGAASGALSGGSVGGWPGAIVGGVAGGLGGYFSGGG